jgi:alternate signal-mediated exported protein
MNKLVKGAIAGAAGIVLLMGGAGSLAYWNDSANAGPGAGSNSITAGTLTIAAANGGSWTKGLYNNAGTQTVAPAAVANLSAVRIVPGNRLVYTQTFNLNATGDDLFFTISNTAGTVVAPASPTAADTALVAQVNASATTGFSVGTVSAGNVALTGVTAGVYKVTGSGTSTITVTWTVDFPFGATAVNTAKGGILNLSQGAITITQVAAP